MQTLRTIAREGCRRRSAAVGNVDCDWSVGGAYCGETERRILVNYLLYPPVNYAKQNHIIKIRVVHLKSKKQLMLKIDIGLLSNAARVWQQAPL